MMGSQEFLKGQSAPFIGAAKSLAHQAYNGFRMAGMLGGLYGLPDLPESTMPQGVGEQTGAGIATAAQLAPAAEGLAGMALSRMASRAAIPPPLPPSGGSPNAPSMGPVAKFLIRRVPGGKMATDLFDLATTKYGPDLSTMPKGGRDQLAYDLFQQTSGKAPETAAEKVTAIRNLQSTLKAKTATTPIPRGPIGSGTYDPQFRGPVAPVEPLTITPYSAVSRTGQVAPPPEPVPTPFQWRDTSVLANKAGYVPPPPPPEPPYIVHSASAFNPAGQPEIPTPTTPAGPSLDELTAGQTGGRYKKFTNAPADVQANIIKLHNSSDAPWNKPTPKPVPPTAAPPVVAPPPGMPEAAPAPSISQPLGKVAPTERETQLYNMLRGNTTRKNLEIGQYFTGKGMTPDAVAQMPEAEFNAHIRNVKNANGKPYEPSTGRNYHRTFEQARDEVVAAMQQMKATPVSPPPPPQ